MNSSQSFLTRDSIANLIRLISLVAIAMGLFAIVTGGVAVYLNLTAQLELERADRVAGRQADRIADELSRIQTSLRDASVVDAARSGSADALRESLRERGVVNILDAHILPGGIDDIALDDDIDLDFAATEMAIAAIRDERPDIRVQQPGTPAESLVLAQRMPGESGVLLLRLTVSVLTSLLEEDEAVDFLALAQSGNPGDTVLGASGRSTAAVIREIPIEGSSLVLQWSRAVVQAPFDNRAAVIFGSSGVIVLMIGLLLRRRTRLARYLEVDNRADNDSRPVQRPATPAWKARPDSERTARKTRVLEPGESGDGSVNLPETDDEPPTVVAHSPDLPEWLRDDVDEGLDEFSDEDLGSTQPLPEAPFPGSGSDEDDELLEEFDTYQGVDPSLFRPDGIHGKAGQELGVPGMVILGQAIGSQAVDQGLRRICVAHDGRESGPELLEGLSQGLSVSGVDVIDLGAAAAPVVWFAGMRMQQAGAVLVTGGNRGEDINGLEIMFNGLRLGREERRTLLDRIRNQEFTTGAGDRSRAEEARNYGEQLTANHRLQRPLRVVLDCGNPVSGTLTPELFEAMGVDLIPLNADAETLPEQVAGFDEHARIQDLQLCVANFAADLGVTFDRTASRLRVVAPDGRVLGPARLAMLLATDSSQQGENISIVADEALADEFERTERGAGVEVALHAGDADELQRRLREDKAGMAVHGDGTVCVAADWHGLPDAIHAAAWLMSVLAADDRPVAEILFPQEADSGDSAAPTGTP